MIERAIPRDKHYVLVDVTSQYAVLAVMGPRSRELLQSVSKADWRNGAFAFGQSREVDIGYATVRATRLTYVGELGWELYVPVEFAVGVYEALREAGKAFGLVNAGYYAIDSLRIEKGYRAWGRELRRTRIRSKPARVRVQARQGHSVPRPRRPAETARRAAAPPHGRAERGRRRGSLRWGGEAILRDGKLVGFVSSAAFGHTLGCPVAMGYVNNPDGAADTAYLTSGAYAIDVAGESLPATRFT